MAPDDDRSAATGESECTRRLVTVGMPDLCLLGGAWMADGVPLEEPVGTGVPSERPVRKRASKAAGGAPKRRRKVTDAAVPAPDGGMAAAPVRPRRRKKAMPRNLAPEAAVARADDAPAGAATVGIVGELLAVALELQADGAVAEGEPMPPTGPAVERQDDGPLVEAERPAAGVVLELGRDADGGAAQMPRIVAQRIVPQRIVPQRIVPQRIVPQRIVAERVGFARVVDGPDLIAVRSVASRGVVTGLVASRSARVPGLAHWMRARGDGPCGPAKPSGPWRTPRVEGDFADRKAPVVDGTERRHTVRQGLGRSIVGGVTSAWAHLAIVLLLLLVAPTSRLGDIAPEPASFGLVWDQTVKAPPPAPKAPEQEAPKAAEPRTEPTNETMPVPPVPPSEPAQAAEEPPVEAAKANPPPAQTAKAVPPSPAETAKAAPPPPALAEATKAAPVAASKTASEAAPPPPAAAVPAVESAPRGTVELQPVPPPSVTPPATQPATTSEESRQAEPQRVRGKPVRHAKAERPAAHRKVEHPVRHEARREEKHRKVEKSEPKREIRHEPPKPAVLQPVRPVPQPTPQVRPQSRPVAPLPQPQVQRPIMPPLQAQPVPRPPAQEQLQPRIQRPAPAPLPHVWTPSMMPNAAPAPQTASPRPNAAAAPAQVAPPAASSEPAHINADWANNVTDWLVQHRTYPTDTRLRDIQGVVIIRFTVAPDGSVLDVVVVQSSGSKGLDKAAMDMVRGGQLPPFPADMTQTQQAVTVPIRYGLE